jgi:hypothetical protein
MSEFGLVAGWIDGWVGGYPQGLQDPQLGRVSVDGWTRRMEERGE